MSEPEPEPEPEPAAEPGPVQNSDLGSTATVSGVGALLSAFKSTPAPDFEDGDDDEEELQEAQLRVELHSEKENELLRELEAKARAADVDIDHLEPFWVQACLRTRKFDVDRALVILRSYVAWRAEFEIDKLGNSDNPVLCEQLSDGAFFSTGGRDKMGRPIICFRLCKQNPAKYSALDTVRTVHFMVMQTVSRQDPAAQARGVTMVNDMSDVGFSNMDPRVPKVLMSAFGSRIPLRINRIFICNPPFFFRLVFPVLSAFMPSKVKNRIRKVDSSVPTADSKVPEIVLEEVDESQMLRMHGGTLEYDHAAWMESACASDKVYRQEVDTSTDFSVNYSTTGCVSTPDSTRCSLSDLARLVATGGIAAAMMVWAGVRGKPVKLGSLIDIDEASEAGEDEEAIEEIMDVLRSALKVV